MYLVGATEAREKHLCGPPGNVDGSAFDMLKEMSVSMFLKQSISH